MTSAQSLDERLDEERFLQGLTELQLEDVLRHYVEEHPPDDPGRAARYEIAAERMRLHDPATEPADRLAAVERILARRAVLLEAETDDPRRSGWLADQASDLFFELLAYEASGLTTIVGLPSPAQRARAERVAREMNDLTAEAEVAIEQTLMDLEAQDGFARDVAAQLRRQRLDRDERRRRIPFLRGVAALLMAELGLVPDDEREDWYALSADTLEPLNGELDGGLGSRTRLYLALALLGLGEEERAGALLDQVIDDDATAAPDRFLARVARVGVEHNAKDVSARLSAVTALESAYPSAPENVVYRLLLADRRHQLLRLLAELEEAFAVYTRLLDEDMGISQSAWRQLVYSRLTSAATGDLPLDRLPVIVLVARAEHLTDDESTRGEAISLLGSILEPGDIPASDRAAALFAMGHALEADDQQLAAARRYTELARDYVEHPRAERAVEQGAKLAAAVDRRSPSDESRAVLRETLDLLTTRYPNIASIDQWRVLSANLAMRERRYDDAIAAYETVGPDSAQWLEAQVLQASAAVGAADQAVESAQKSRREAALDTISRVRPLIESATADTRSPSRAADARRYQATLRVFEADLMLDLNRPDQAAAVLDGLEDAQDLPGAVIAEALRLRINAFRALGRAADAQREAARFIEAAPDDAGRVIGSMLAAVQREVRALLEISRDDDAANRARDELVPLAHMLEEWLDGRAVDADQRFQLERQIADAYRLAQAWPEAVPIYDRLLASHPNALQLLFGRAECLYAMGGDGLAEAMTIYRRLGAAGPGADDATSGYYWQAQVRMLQILDATGRNTAKIVPRIQRLRQQDPELGGERYRRQLEVLQNKYSQPAS